jgi:two-component system chemotaxis response regulator CheB
MIRVLVVDDSLTVRKRIVAVLTEGGYDVVAEAADGKSAIDLCERLRPDVITLDMMLPVMTGLAATEYIMAHRPTPILIVSASTNRGELFKTYDALAAGAVDVLEKPLGDGRDDDWERRLVEAVRMVAKIRVITHPRGKLGPVVRNDPAPSAGSVRRIVAIGASTGGPGALLEILSGLPAGFPVPILLVVHIGEPFGSALAEWLDSQTGFSVRQAVHGENLPGGATALLAPAGKHLELAEGRLRLSDAPERHSCRPSVDVLFESVARTAGAEAIGCLLTGMGRDGAAGLLAMRRAGAATLAQDEATSIIYGMPGEAVKLGAAQHVVPLPQIAQRLTSLAAGSGSRP